jgi:hypothetical protein
VAGAWAHLVASTASTCAVDAAAAEALSSGLRVIEEHNLSEYAVTWFLDSSSAKVGAEIAPKFWAYFEGFELVKGSKGAAEWASARVSAALGYLSRALDAQLQVARAIESSCVESGKHYGVASKCRANLAAVVFRPVLPHFHEILYLFLSREFANFARNAPRIDDEANDDRSSSDADEDGDTEMGADNGLGGESQRNRPTDFRHVCLSLSHVGALPMAEEVLTEVSHVNV